MKSRWDVRGVTRFWVGLVAGLVVGGLVWGLTGLWQPGLMAVIVTEAVVYLVWSIAILWPMGPDETKEHSEAADVTDDLGDLAIVGILAASMASIAVLLLSAQDENRAWYASLSVLAVLASWGMLHTLYAARYARIYYEGDDGGIDFNTSVKPCYIDFFYFSFNLGMTYQVSDTNVTPTAIRRQVLKHCLLSYVYGTVIIATTINLVMNLVS